MTHTTPSTSAQGPAAPITPTPRDEAVRRELVQTLEKWKARMCAGELAEIILSSPAMRASLASDATPAPTSGSEDGAKAILDGIAEALESAGYVHMANKAGIASILAELDALAKPASEPAGGVREALDWHDGFHAFRTGPCVQDLHTAFVSGWMYRAEQEAALAPATEGRKG